MELPDSSQPIKIVIVGFMMAIRWLENHFKENNRQETPTREQLQELNSLKGVGLSDGNEKDMGQKKTDAWFRANMTAWLYEYAKKPYVETQQSVQCVSAGNWSRSF